MTVSFQQTSLEVLGSGCGSVVVAQWLWLSGCGSVGKVVATVRIPSSANFLLNIVQCQLYWKEENKEKEDGNGDIFKKRRFK